MRTKSIHRQIAYSVQRQTLMLHWLNLVWGIQYHFFPFKGARDCYADLVLADNATKIIIISFQHFVYDN